MARLFRSSLKLYPLDTGGGHNPSNLGELCPVVHFTLQSKRNVYCLTSRGPRALESFFDITIASRLMTHSGSKGVLSLPLLESGSERSCTHLNVTCRRIFATMAVTVRMRRVARPYTVHPASAKDSVYQTCWSSVFKRRSVGVPE